MSEQSNTAHSSEYNGMAILGTNPLGSGLDGIESTEIQSIPSNQNSENQNDHTGKKRKQSQMAAKLGEFIDYRKNQIDKTLKKLEEKKRYADESIDNYIYIADSMEELTDEERADANELFQSEMNRQIFLKTQNPKVRLIWLKKKISKMSWESYHGGGS